VTTLRSYSCLKALVSKGASQLEENLTK